MRATVRIANAVPALALLIVSVGCSTTHKHTEASSAGGKQTAIPHAYKKWPFNMHPNPGVRIPARVGADTGAIVGFPLTFALMPITVPIAAVADLNLFPLAPFAYCVIGGETMCGAVAWPFFGWWHWPSQRGVAAPAIHSRSSQLHSTPYTRPYDAAESPLPSPSSSNSSPST
jgi:hypothetical protein